MKQKQVSNPVCESLQKSAMMLIKVLYFTVLLTFCFGHEEEEFCFRHISPSSTTQHALAQGRPGKQGPHGPHGRKGEKGDVGSCTCQGLEIVAMQLKNIQGTVLPSPTFYKTMA